MNDPKLRERRKALRNNPTEAEKIFWGHVRNRQFCGLRFFRQYSCGPYILDFYCPNIKLAVEIDGGQHNDEEIRNYDEARSDYLRAHGIEVIRFWNNNVVRDMDGVLSLLVKKVTPPHLPLAQGEETAEVLAAEYKTVLPDEKILANEIERSSKMLERRGAIKK